MCQESLGQEWIPGMGSQTTRLRWLGRVRVWNACCPQAVASHILGCLLPAGCGCGRQSLSRQDLGWEPQASSVSTPWEFSNIPAPPGFDQGTPSIYGDFITPEWVSQDLKARRPLYVQVHMRVEGRLPSEPGFRRSPVGPANKKSHVPTRQASNSSQKSQ